MKALEFLRRKLFWSVDAIKGGKVTRHLKDIASLQRKFHDNGYSRVTEGYLTNLITHATTSVPLYKNFTKDNVLQDFPVVDKAYIRDNFKLFESKEFIDKKKYKVTTSGSTGKPFYILHDKNKRDRNTADTIYFSEKAGYKLGARLYYLRLWDKQYKKGNFLSWVQNVRTNYSVDNFNDQKIAGWIRELENDNSNKSILGYTSALQAIFKFLDNKKAKPLETKINGVVAIAEGLDEYVRKGVKKYFKTHVVSRYSNSENGIIAQQNMGNRNFEVNWASYFVEILDLNKDIPVPNGTLGRIVITDLFSYAMPLIRYDTGDVGILNFETKDDCKALVLSQIEGRKMDMFTNTKGEFITSHIVHHILQFNGIDQFQFIQESNNKYIIKLKVAYDFDYDDELEIIKKYQEFLGHDANINIEYVIDIPLLKSGKRKLVVNNALNTLPKMRNKSKEESGLKTI
ncbi:phenylacetate--CoA ligase family protein [Arenibacter sp. 6A1]|uniref:phenylacetate--CoA ligase family protein n=1 Tax=Arenibacter sp. 6A1 TaxID=2720391 RepID=UPI001448629D|nr:phenylacetate--CoA ligase family protein [Arenibacter sp. 6A1]NKI27099.1 phenylacetate--CoA ligase family protein [Arenibacter sp. 6A1]